MKQIYYLFGVIGVLVAIGAWVFLSQPITPNTGNITLESEASPTTTPLVSIENPLIATSSSIITPDAKGKVFARIGDVVGLPGGSFKILGVTQDSRCPAGVACIWAGEVQLSLLVTEKNNNSTKIIIKSNAPAIIIGKSDVTLVEVNPAKQQGLISNETYRFVFMVKASTLKAQPPVAVIPTTGIHGMVLIGPTCPVVREGVDCPDRPGADVTLGVYDMQSKLIKKITTDNNGSTGVISLPVGVYLIKQIDGNVYPRIPETKVRVLENQITEFTIHGDSGIR